MSRDDIIRMAQEASILGSFDMLQGNQWRQDTIRDLERFAALVAAAEREACAAIAETPVTGEQDDITMEAKDRVANAIRARGQA